MSSRLTPKETMHMYLHTTTARCGDTFEGQESLDPFEGQGSPTRRRRQSSCRWRGAVSLRVSSSNLKDPKGCASSCVLEHPEGPTSSNIAKPQDLQGVPRRRRRSSCRWRGAGSLCESSNNLKELTGCASSNIAAPKDLQGGVPRRRRRSSCRWRGAGS